MDPGGRSGDQALPSSGLSSHLEMGHISVQERDAVDGDGRLSCHCPGQSGHTTSPPHMEATRGQGGDTPDSWSPQHPPYMAVGKPRSL